MTLQPWFEAQKNKRQDWYTIEKAWLALHPEWENRPGLNDVLLGHLRELEALGHVQMPKDPKRWSRGTPSCPEWCLYTPSKELGLENEYSGPWHAKLGFNTQYKGDTLQLLVKVNLFLLNRDRFDYLVPLKERSLQICGDEKRLDSFRVGNTHLFKGLLALEDIGAFHAEAPLAYEVYADSTTTIGLILENQDSYYSFREWNKKHRYYRAVVYGSGYAFSSSYRNLPALQTEHNVQSFQYLGDLDYTGFQIPAGVASLCATGLLPATTWYTWLVEHGIARPNKAGVDQREPSPWLNNSFLHEAICKLWLTGQWIPQESLGLDQLMALDPPQT